MQPGVPRISIEGRNIMISVGNHAKAQLFLKGVDYSPIPICSNYLESPISDKNTAIWQRDLPILRKLGVNAIKLYNSNSNANISAFLKAAYNGGTNPIYTILSIRFNPDIPLNSGAVADLSGQYQKLAQTNGNDPDVIGMSIGSEVNDANMIKNPAWWRGMTALANAAKNGFKLAGHPEKFTTTTFVDDGFNSEKAGEQNNFPVDVWGINFYRGPTFGQAFKQYAAISKKPMMVSEWGTSYSWHATGKWDEVSDVPAGKVSLFTNFVSGLAKELWQNRTASGGVASGGFYFEFTDEWWKATGGDDCKHLPGPKGSANNVNFPGGFDDEGWFGLNAIAAGTPNKLTQRPTFTALKTAFAAQ